MNQQRRFFMPLVLLFIILNGLILVFGNRIDAAGFDRTVLLVANLLFFTVSMTAFFIQRKALQNSNPNVFIRSVMGSMFIKMLVVVAAFVVYILIVRKAVNKLAVFGAMTLYLLYLVTEVTAVMKLNRKKDG